MRKLDNNWHLRLTNDLWKEEEMHEYEVGINGETYFLPEHLAGLAHAFLLLVDAINDRPTNDG